MKERFKKRFKKKHLNLFAKYFLVITMVIFICFAVLGCSLLLFVSNYWRSEKTSLLKENALQVASTTADLLGAAKKIEEEMEYPGQIKVNLIRETKCVEYAK